MKRMLFVYNPRAGKGLLRLSLSDIVDIFVKAGYDVVVYPTQAYRDAYRKITEFTEEYDLVVCSGGDGTIDEVVTGMMGRERKIPVGYIPTGTTNDFANSLRIPKDLLAAADNAVNGAAFPCDIGQFNDDVFVYIAAFGLFTDVSYATSQDLKNRIGHLAYLLEGVKRITSIQSFHLQISVNGREIEDEFIYGMITNSTSAGGFKNITGKNVKLDDGMFEVTLIRMPKNPIELNAIIASLTNLIDDTDLIYTFKTDALNIRSLEKISWTLDGEYGGDHIEVEIYNEKQAVEIMVKPGMKFLPENTFLFGRNKL